MADRCSASLHCIPSRLQHSLSYLLLDVLLITCVMLLYFRALQISPLSMCVPFLSFTPVFLIPTGFIILGETPAPLKLIGVALIVVGSLAMHRRLFAEGWLAPAKAVIREKGSRYMLLVSFIFALTNPLDKKLVTMSDVFTEALAYGIGLSIAFWIMAKVQRGDFMAASRNNWKWISLAALSDAVSLLFQLASYAYIAVVITVSIKRAGIVLSVFSGWLFFHERGITDKVIAASVMFCGVLILYLPLVGDADCLRAFRYARGYDDRVLFHQKSGGSRSAERLHRRLRRHGGALPERLSRSRLGPRGIVRRYESRKRATRGSRLRSRATGDY